MSEMTERNMFKPAPFIPRVFAAPAGSLEESLVFGSRPVPASTQAGLETNSSTAARDFVLQDLDVAAGRRRGLPPSDAEVSIDNLLQYILHAGDFVDERPKTPPPPPEKKSALVAAERPKTPPTPPFDLPDRARLLGSDYHRNVLAVAARLLEREPNAPFVTFTKWCATVLGQYPPGEKATLRAQMSLQGLQALELSSCSLVAGDAFVIGQYIQLSGGRLWTVDLSCNDLQDQGAAYVCRAMMAQLEDFPKCDVRVLNLSANGIGADGAFKTYAREDGSGGNGGNASLRKKTRPDPDAEVNRGAVAISNLIRTNKTIRTLDLSKNHFGPVSTQEIARAMMTNKTLQSMLYSAQADPRHPGRGISERGAAAFAALMATGGNKVALTRLDLSNNGLGPGGALAIEEALGGKRRRQTRLTASVDADASMGLAKAAQRRARSLTTLILSYNRFGRLGGRSIGNLLANNATITNLDVSYNSMGELDEQGFCGKGLARLAVGLGKNTTLRKLDLSGNGVSNTGAMSLATALKKRGGCQITLKLCANEIEMVGAKELQRALKDTDNLDLMGNTLRPPTDELRRPLPGVFYSRTAPGDESGRSRWVQSDLNTAVDLGPRIATGLGTLHRSSILVQRSDVVAHAPRLFQAKSYARAGVPGVGRRKRIYV
jgi:hypothetical protein